jgi:5-methylcytosine-specific restriction protein B
MMSIKGPALPFTHNNNQSLPFCDSHQKNFLSKFCAVPPDALCDPIITKVIGLNNRIAQDTHLGKEFCIGHSFSCPEGNDFSGRDENWYSQIVSTEIGPLLNEYWYDDRGTARRETEELLR